MEVVKLRFVGPLPKFHPNTAPEWERCPVQQGDVAGALGTDHGSLETPVYQTEELEAGPDLGPACASPRTPSRLAPSRVAPSGRTRNQVGWIEKED